MKTTVDKTTMFKLLENLTKMFEPDISNVTLPSFENKVGLWFHDNHHTITVVRDDNELKFPTSKPDWPNLLGIYKIETTNEEGKLILFSDAIKEKGKKYSDKKSKHFVNGERIDLNDTHDSWGGNAKPNGLSESDAFIYIEILCKIELILLNIIHNRLGVWKSDFYSEKNIEYLDILVMQLTKEVIKDYDELVDCFTWLNINMVNDSEFILNTPVPFVKNISGIDDKEEEWLCIYALDIFINCFPIEDKNHAETWTAFFDRTKENAEENLMKQVNHRKQDDNGVGWEIINDYLTSPENKSKCEKYLLHMRYGIGPKQYKRKWWKTWN
jgi:hypothetical protein